MVICIIVRIIVAAMWWWLDLNHKIFEVNSDSKFKVFGKSDSRHRNSTVLMSISWPKSSNFYSSFLSLFFLKICSLNFLFVPFHPFKFSLFNKNQQDEKNQWKRSQHIKQRSRTCFKCIVLFFLEIEKLRRKNDKSIKVWKGCQFLQTRRKKLPFV